MMILYFYHILLLRHLICSLNSDFVDGKIGHIIIPKDQKCPSSQEFFDHSGLICKRCASFSKPILKRNDEGILTTAIGCECEASSLQLNDVCSLEEMATGSCLDITCVPTCRGSLATSIDHSICVSCDSKEDTSNSTEGIDDGVVGIIRYDDIIGDCSCNNPSPGVPESRPIVTYKLVEIYDQNSGLPISKKCMRCPTNSAVITSNLLGNGKLKFTTAGATFYPDEYKCAYCPDPNNMYFDTDYECKCKDGYFMVGEATVATQKCIKHAPTIASSDYNKVNFSPFTQDQGSAKDLHVTLNSIIFSHYYLVAASRCEYMDGQQLERSLNACQTLANLCVMTHYDSSQPSCRQFQSIISVKRKKSYRNEANWFEGMPWLYYNDEVDDVVEDRSIQMTMSLKEKDGAHHRMSYRLAKYNIEGKLVGIERLSDQFQFCANSNLVSGDFGFRFGQGERYEFNCNINSLVHKEMYFYDLYLVDESCESTASDNGEDECLFPVPVLNRNLVEGDSLPNQNHDFTSELDDVYTRRFFLFDNLSGKEHDGLKYIRYASKIALQTKIQSQAVGKIYPPTLIIQYVDLEVDFDSFNSSTATATFVTEYTMITKQFWTTVEVLSGFVSAATFVLWVFRVYNSYSRLRYTSGNIQEGVMLQFIVGAAASAVHCFVSCFFAFLFGCAIYWYIFLNLQDTAFLLLPPENDYEYRFYKLFIHSLCWAHSLFIFYLIYCQCQTDIFFVDWGASNNDVSMWRTVMAANEFNRLQHKRKNLIEINLIIVVFCLVLGEYGTTDNMSTVHQNIVMRFAHNCLMWFFAGLSQTLFRLFWYERFFAEPRGQRLIDLCTLAKQSIIIMDTFHHGYYLHCRSSYESADCGMDSFNNEMKKEGSGLMVERGLDSPGCPLESQVFELFASDVFSIQFRKLLLTSESVSNEHLPTVKNEIHSFLTSFIEQSPTPQQQGLKLIIRKPMVSERFLCIAPSDNGGHSTECILQPNNITWSQDYSFLSTTFLGIEYQLFLHDILTFHVIDLFMSNSSFLALAITYLLHSLKTWIRKYFGSKNFSTKAMIDKRFILW